MSDIAYAEEAKDWANKLILGESRGPGDMDNAMIRLEARYGIPKSILWALRYRPLKDPKTSIYFRLQAAWEDFRLRQLKALQHDITITEALAGPHRSSLHAAKAMVGAVDGGEG